MKHLQWARNDGKDKEKHHEYVQKKKDNIVMNFQ